jgi:NADH-quinone oxidoreductase subunit N
MKLLLLPDILLLVTGFAALGVDLFLPRRGARAAFHLAWGGALLVFGVLFLLPSDQQALFMGGYEVNGRSLLFKQLFALSAVFTILLAGSYFQAGPARKPLAYQDEFLALLLLNGSGPANGSSRQPLAYRGEFCALIIFATFGMFTVVSATDLLTLLVGMELATIPLYALCGFRKECPLASEASTKYIIIGGLSTAISLFGYSFIYGAAGSLHFAPIFAFAGANPDSALLLVGALFVLAGAGFKLTLFPFHMWAPDVYQGAPAPVTAFLAVSSKATAVAFLLVLLSGPLAPIHGHLQPAILLLAGLTMTVGNLGALRQRNLLRFLAYSSIAQAGYIVLAFVSQSTLASAAIYYYLLVYAAANFAVFFIIAVAGRSRSEELDTLQGLGQRSPVLGAILMLAMFSLAGIPPLAGFTGKFMLFAAAALEGYHWMVVFAALNSTISLYYYPLLVKEAYITNPGFTLPALGASPIQRFSLVPLTGAMLLLGLLPMVSTAIQKVFG